MECAHWCGYRGWLEFLGPLPGLYQTADENELRNPISPNPFGSHDPNNDRLQARCENINQHEYT